MAEDIIHTALRTDRTIDITTTGAKTGQPRTIEIWFHNLDGELFICGTPGGPHGPGHRHPRSWLANLVAHPEFVFHLKESVQADIPARATRVTDAPTRRRYLSAPSTQWYREQGYSVDELVKNAPVVALELDVDKAVLEMNGFCVTRVHARVAATMAVVVLLSACVSTGGGVAPTSPHAQVTAAERAFAATMAARDIDAFATFIDDEAVFFSGAEPLRGKAAVVTGWAPLFEGDAAPFSWQPDQVEVLASGTLALSTGPVMNPDGKPVARFNSIWRRDAAGDWKIVFDKGSPLEPARGD